MKGSPYMLVLETETDEECGADQTLDWPDVSALLGAGSWREAADLLDSGAIQRYPRHLWRVGAPNTCYAWIEDYWARQEQRGVDVSPLRQRGHDLQEARAAALEAERQAVVRREEAEREQRDRLAAARAKRQAVRAWWERTALDRTPARVRARLGKGDPEERFTLDQVATILCRPRSSVYLLIRYYQEDKQGLDSVREGQRLYCTRAMIRTWLKRFATRDQQDARLVWEKAVRRAEGRDVACCVCNALIGWVPGQRERADLFCSVCGAKERKRAVDAIGAPR